MIDNKKFYINGQWVSPKKSEVAALAEGEVAPNYYFDNATNTWVEITE